MNFLMQYLLASALRVGTTPLGGDSVFSGGGRNLYEPLLWYRRWVGLFGEWPCDISPGSTSSESMLV